MVPVTVTRTVGWRGLVVGTRTTVENGPGGAADAVPMASIATASPSTASSIRTVSCGASDCGRPSRTASLALCTAIARSSAAPGGTVPR